MALRRNRKKTVWREWVAERVVGREGRDSGARPRRPGGPRRETWEGMRVLSCVQRGPVEGFKQRSNVICF